MQPTHFTARLEEKQTLNDRFFHFHFELTQPHVMEFQAGQYVSIKVGPDGDRRSYSICSTPDINHGFELLIDVQPDGKGCKYLCQLKFGDEIELLAPMGQFMIQTEPREKEIVLIATGAGIAPYRAMILDQLQAKRDQRPITLHWGMRHTQELFWLDEFEQLMENFANFHFYPVLSQPERDWTLSRGRVTDVLTAEASLSREAGYYLCGNSTMIQDVKKLLLSKGIPETNIHHEKFF